MPPERTDALLTTSQRAFLDGETDYNETDSGGRATRSRMRERLQAGLLDFAYLADPEGLADRDVEQLEEAMATNQQLDQVLREMVAFIYRIRPTLFESVIEEGVERGVQRFTPTYEVGEVTIPIHRQGRLVKQARRKLAEDQPLTEPEIRVLLTDESTDPMDLQEHVRSHPRPRVELTEYR